MVNDDEGTDQQQANDLDSFADAYAAETDEGLVNAHYERPEILRLVGDV